MAADRFVRKMKVAAALICICFLCELAVAIDRNALEQCVESDMFGVSDASIISDADITASSWMPKRDGHFGRLFNESVWQAASNNYNQYLQIDLGQQRLITSLATQGFRGSGQFVTAYHITYSNDESTFIAIVNDLGEPREFPGNTHDDKPQFNLLDFPIVARWVRFVPVRWNINIAMRVELYGCAYEGSVAYFNGESSITFNAHEPNSLFTTVDMLRFRMRTHMPEGVVFYAGGNQGDHICLELLSGRLYLDMSLGSLSWSESQARGVAGSLLDDNQWHDIQLIREYKNVTISVDRVPVNITIEGEYQRLDLDRYLHVGGVSTFYQPGIQARKNFVGCIENFVWNGIHMNRDKDRDRFSTTGEVLSSCPQDNVVASPITLPETGSHIVYKAASITRDSLQFKLDFRTFDKDRLLVWNTLNKNFNFFLSIGPMGHIEFELQPIQKSFTIKEVARSDLNQGSYADGLWHRLWFKASRNSIEMDIDGKVFLTTRQLTFTANSTFVIGGGHPERQGFVGCLRSIQVQFESEGSEMLKCGVGTASCVGVELDTCGMEDRCRPNPCEHGSSCVQTFNEFSCNCSGTGYQGATCHQSLYPNSCTRVFELQSKETGEVNTKIDIDGAGALTPFDVICRFNQEENMVETELSHDSTHEILVDGYQDPGSYRREIHYDTNLTQTDQLIYRAMSCRQFIKYRCEGSKLLAPPTVGSVPPGGGNEDGTGPDFGQVYKSYGWWVGRNNQNNYYWGGAVPSTQMCGCGLTGSCKRPEYTCNCDAGLLDEAIEDSGFLRHKQHLPVIELRFGDTQALYDRKRGWHTLGPLICSGDRLFDQPVTFRKIDSVIYFDTFWSRDSTELQTWDISFRFKTAAESGVMVHRVGESDFIEIKLVTSTSISFRFSAGYGVQAVVIDTAFPLNVNEKWHSVYAERNRLEAVIQVDEFEPVRLPHPVGVGYLPFQFSGPLYVGGTSGDGRDGYVGCMSSLQYNGETLDLHSRIDDDEIFQYGTEKGCVGKCDSNPCLNGGICKEKYNEFICDCSYTPFRGLICGREVGVSIYEGQMLEYRPPGDLKTVSEKITLGFFTRKKQGVLMQLTDRLNDPQEYMVFEMNSGGGIRVSFKFNDNRQQVNTKISNDIDLANGQPHVIRFERLQGKRMRLQVDDYEPVTEEDLGALYPSASDRYLDDIRYVLLGRNTSAFNSNNFEGKTEFEGCLFRAEFDNHWPIKNVFRAPRPPFVDVLPSFDSVREERCGFEEILPDPEPIEIRPTYEPAIRVTSEESDEAVERETAGQNAAYLGVIFGVVGIILILIISVVVYKCRNTGEYADSDDDEELEMFDTSGVDNDDYDNDYKPRSSSERYQSRKEPSEQRFI